MRQEMFGTLPDGTLYTKRRNLWNKPLQNVVTYKGFECQKLTCGIGQTKYLFMSALPVVGPVGRETHFTVSYDYIFVRRELGTTNVMNYSYYDGMRIAQDGLSGTQWFGQLNLSGDPLIHANADDWLHLKYTFSFNVDEGKAINLSFYPAFLRDIDADLYIRNIMITYGDEDYPYTPAPEIDETVVLT